MNKIFQMMLENAQAVNVYQNKIQTLDLKSTALEASMLVMYVITLTQNQCVFVLVWKSLNESISGCIWKDITHEKYWTWV